MSSDPTDDLARAVREYVARYLPGQIARRVRIDLDGGEQVVLPVPAVPVPTARKPRRQSLSPLQITILEVLDGKGMKTDSLARACQVERSRLFKPGGLKELQESDPPRVEHDNYHGFYRPDSPPEELAGE